MKLTPDEFGQHQQVVWNLDNISENVKKIFFCVTTLLTTAPALQTTAATALHMCL